MKNNIRSAAIAAALITSGTAMAATDTANMDVTLLVDTACAIESVPSLSMSGSSGAGVTYNYNAGSIDVLCAPGVPYTLSVSGSQNGYGDLYNRRAANGGNTVDYYVWDPVYGYYYGDGATYYGDLRFGTGSGSTEQYPVAMAADFGYVPAGIYTDTLIVTVTY